MSGKKVLPGPRGYAMEMGPRASAPVVVLS